MKIKVIYREPNGESLSHELRCDPVDVEACKHLCRKIAMQGFFMEDGEIGIYVPPLQALKVLMLP